MTWLHNNIKVSIEKLVTDSDNNSTYVLQENTLEGYFKKINLADGTFDISNISGTAYKFTIKEIVEIGDADRLIISEGKYEGKYSVSDVKFTDCITYSTTKILIII